jgi:hypothetical protein
MGTTDYDAEITGITDLNGEVVVIDKSHLGTTGAHVKMFGDLTNWQSFNADIHFDPNKNDTLKSAMGLEQTITLTFKTITGETSGATASFTGGISSFNGSVPFEDKMVGNYTMSILGDVTFTDAS